LDWIDPIDLAINRAIMLSSPFSQNPEGRQQRWPDLLGEIAKMDLRPRHRILLPPDIYTGAGPIINILDEIYTLSIQMQQERTLMNSNSEENYWTERWKNHFKELDDKLEHVRIFADQY